MNSFKKCRGNHVPAAAHKRDHTAGRGCKGHREKHEFCRSGVGLDTSRSHEGQHGGNTDGGRRCVVHQARSVTEPDGQKEGEPDHAVARLARDGLAEALGQASLFQRNGEHEAAHDENHHRVHVRRPGPLDIGHAGQNQQHADAHGGQLQWNRLEDEQKYHETQHGQKSFGCR